METPAIDVVIAARNEARFIGDCLTALREQDYPSGQITIYVVDNGSADATPQIASRQGARVLRETRPGAAAVRNRGIRGGRGELIALLDAHCLVEQGWIRRMAARFTDARLGGCQGWTDHRATNHRVQRYLRRTGELSN